MPNKKSEDVILKLETIDEILQQLNGDQSSLHLDALMRLLKGTEESKEVRVNLRLGGSCLFLHSTFS